MRELLRTATKEVAKAIQATGLPVVELLGDFQMASPHVHSDETLVGRMAAEHLLDQGLRNFAYFAFGDSWYIRLSRGGFQQRLKEQGFSCHVYKSVRSQGKAYPHWCEEEWPHLLDWLGALPRPIGIFAVNDSHALRLMSACRMLEIAMPEEVAILGVDNDPVICDATSPPLSSVDVNCARIGYEAAALLDRMMGGEKPPRKPILVPPERVAARRSTDVLAIEDADVAHAVRFIREFACREIDVAQVCKEVGVSRRVLERRFHSCLRRTPKKEILRVQIGRAKSLLVQTDLSVAAVGKRAGFAAPEYFVRVFRRAAGATPRTYRMTQRRCVPGETP